MHNLPISLNGTVFCLLQFSTEVRYSGIGIGTVIVISPPPSIICLIVSFSYRMYFFNAILNFTRTLPVCSVQFGERTVRRHRPPHTDSTGGSRQEGLDGTYSMLDIVRVYFIRINFHGHNIYCGFIVLDYILKLLALWMSACVDSNSSLSMCLSVCKINYRLC